MKILNGRDRVALTDGDEEVELNVSLGIQHSYPVEITRHTVEKEKRNDLDYRSRDSRSKRNFA